VFLAYLPLGFASSSVISRIEDNLQRVMGSARPPSTDHGTARDRDVNISALGVNELIYAATRDAFFLPMRATWLSPKTVHGLYSIVRK
jgi:hypothetical protein